MDGHKMKLLYERHDRSVPYFLLITYNAVIYVASWMFQNNKANLALFENAQCVKQGLVDSSSAAEGTLWNPGDVSDTPCPDARASRPICAQTM